LDSIEGAIWGHFGVQFGQLAPPPTVITKRKGILGVYVSRIEGCDVGPWWVNITITGNSKHRSLEVRRSKSARKG
jgi:hypothetical protein